MIDKIQSPGCHGHGERSSIWRTLCDTRKPIAPNFYQRFGAASVPRNITPERTCLMLERLAACFPPVFTLLDRFYNEKGTLKVEIFDDYEYSDIIFGQIDPINNVITVSFLLLQSDRGFMAPRSIPRWLDYFIILVHELAHFEQYLFEPDENFTLTFAFNGFDLKEMDRENLLRKLRLQEMQAHMRMFELVKPLLDSDAAEAIFNSFVRRLDIAYLYKVYKEQQSGLQHNFDFMGFAPEYLYTEKRFNHLLQLHQKDEDFWEKADKAIKEGTITWEPCRAWLERNHPSARSSV